VVEVAPKDVRIALPGPLGEYAFYSFLENFLRNAAKHNRDKVGSQGLEVTLALSGSTGDPDFYDLAVWDNVTDPDAEVTFECDSGKLVRGKLVAKMAKLLRRDLISDTGRLRREAWGLAEMKIAAALLGGNWQVTRLAEVLRVEAETPDGQKRLVFKLRLMKPKRIFAVAMIEDAGDLEANGVIVKGSVKELRSYLVKRESPASADFFLLDLFPAQGNSNNLPGDKELEELVGQLYMLPFRMVCAIPPNTNLPGPLAELLGLRKLVVVHEPPPWMNEAEGLERWAWRNWLRRWIDEGGQAQQCAVNVFLDQDADEEPTKSWREFATGHNSKEQLQLFKVTLNVVHRRDSASHAQEETITRRVFYDRHGRALGSHVINLKSDAYIWFDKLSPDFVRIFTKDPSALLPFQLMEAGLLRILVIDERIAELAGRDSGLPHEDQGPLRWVLRLDPTQYKPSAWHLAYAARVLVCTSLSWDGEFEWRWYTNGDFCKVTVNSAEITCRCDVGGRTETYSKEDIDVCIIHQGILDDLKCGPEQALRRLQDLIPLVIVDSGRGIPPGLPGTQKFVPFSVLEALIGQRPGKLVLSQLLMQLTRRAEEFA